MIIPFKKPKPPPPADDSHVYVVLRPRTDGEGLLIVSAHFSEAKADDVIAGAWDAGQDVAGWAVKEYVAK